MGELFTRVQHKEINHVFCWLITCKYFSVLLRLHFIHTFTLAEPWSHTLWAAKLLLLQDLPLKSDTCNDSVHQKRGVGTFLLRERLKSISVNFTAFITDTSRRKKTNRTVTDSRLKYWRVVAVKITITAKDMLDCVKIVWLHQVYLSIWYKILTFIILILLFYRSPTNTILLLKYSLQHWMCINLPLKIVPNKSTIYFCLSNVC